MPPNFLPAALATLRGDAQGRGRVVYLLQGDDQRDPRERAVATSLFGVLSHETLARPDRLTERLNTFLGNSGLGIETDSFLGPPTARRERLEGVPMQIPQARLEGGRQVRRAMVIVDSGIAFWHPRFGGNALGGTPLFQGVASLGFSPRLRLLGPQELASFRQLAALPDGDRVVIDRLRRAIPRSHFGRWRGLQDFWHGTAVADLAVDPARGAEVALFGLELPQAVVEDRGGDSLTTIMPLVIHAALALTAGPQLRGLPLDIVLPYAFTGGPHDGSHPVAASISGLLASAQGSNREVRLLLAAGNHRQDACHAFLPAGGERAVDWHVPPDDYSPNTVQIIIPGGSGEEVMLDLIAPGGLRAELSLGPEEFSLLIFRDQIVGAVARSADRGGAARLRLTLAPTASDRRNAALASAGQWTLGIGKPDHSAQLWILRDDHDFRDHGPWPRRASRFVHPAYEEHDVVGQWQMGDHPGAVIRRAGTMSVMATVPGVRVVAAAELVPQAAPRPAPYSGLRADAQPTLPMVPVDHVIEAPGRPCFANGTRERFRMSGTSAATAIAARDV